MNLITLDCYKLLTIYVLSTR